VRERVKSLEGALSTEQWIERTSNVQQFCKGILEQIELRKSNSETEEKYNELLAKKDELDEEEQLSILTQIQDREKKAIKIASEKLRECKNIYEHWQPITYLTPFAKK